MTENNQAASSGSASSAPESGPQQQTPVSRSKFPTVGDLLALLGIFLVANLIAYLVAVILGFPSPDMKALLSDDEAVRTAAQRALAPTNALSYFISMSLTLAGYLYYRMRRGGPRMIGSFSLKGLDPMLLLWGAVLMMASGVVLEPLLGLLPAPPNVYGRGVWALVTMVVMAPLFEEVLCRGVVLESLRAKYGVTVAWIGSSVVFGLLHLHPVLVINAFAIGLIFAFIYIKSGSLWTTIVLHAFNNAVAYAVLTTVNDQSTMLIDLIGSRTLYVLIYIGALAVFVVSGYMMLRTLKGLKEGDKKEPEA